MNIRELRNKLEESKVPSTYYTINGNLSSDIYVLEYVHGYWESFYFDEKGNRNDYHRFNNENDACQYFWKVIENEMRY